MIKNRNIQTNTKHSKYQFLNICIVGNIGTLEYWNVRILAQYDIYFSNLLNIKTNIKINKEIINGLTNQLYNRHYTN
jgi:hypothetical protein